MDLFEKCLDETRRKFDNMLICGDLNLPKVPWDCPDSWIAANERCFVDILNDHFLIQHNGFLTWGNNVLELVISSIPDQVNVTEVLEPNEAEMFTDHCIVSFELSSAVKAPPKLRCFVYDYARGHFNGLILHFNPWTCPMQYPLETLIYIGTGIAGKTPSYWAWLELFNWYFMSLFTSDPITCNSADEEYAGPNVDPTSSDLTFTVTQVLNVLANFDASKAMGPHEIPARILKEIAYEIAPFLCKLFNVSPLPMDWKLANVVPVFKKDNKE